MARHRTCEEPSTAPLQSGGHRAGVRMLLEAEKKQMTYNQRLIELSLKGRDVGKRVEHKGKKKTQVSQ